MNRVTGILARRRRGCDVGVVTPVRVFVRMAMLHRQGQNQTDRFGSDLAITIFETQTGYMKTALFQIKKSHGYSVVLEKQQMSDAMIDPRVADRNFILAVDEFRAGIRVAKTADEFARLNATQSTITSNCTTWSFFTTWFWRWLSCDEGPISDPTDGNSVEALLDRFIVQAPDWESPWRVNADVARPERYHPSRVWLSLFFEPTESPRP